MIYLNLNIRNPWWVDRFHNVRSWHGSTPFENKYWEVQILKNDNLLRLEFGFTIREDHAGSNLELGLFGYEIHFTLYDNRHWNYEQGRWQNYDDAS